ncbi:uncharacterized protein LOC113565705 [Drosophila persimilis]|uniref:uncharacterized protein LOC113565705 n=1 Tax=Drosophila persimilis TaxID=7234 RepID=UPI000F0858BB|nr:uncharacterized protein LOC113565705 [Drosophila persimilis]
MKLRHAMPGKMDGNRRNYDINMGDQQATTSPSSPLSRQTPTCPMCPCHAAVETNWTSSDFSWFFFGTPIYIFRHPPRDGNRLHFGGRQPKFLEPGLTLEMDAPKGHVGVPKMLLLSESGATRATTLTSTSTTTHPRNIHQEGRRTKDAGRRTPETTVVVACEAFVWYIRVPKR